MTQAAQLAQYGANNVGLSFKNRIINGDMAIAQRGTSFSFPTGGGTNYYGADRFRTFDYQWSSGSNPTVSNDTTVFPTGFRNSYKYATGGTGLTFSSGGYQQIEQAIEGFNIADCYSENITISFWVRSSTAGQYNICLTNNLLNFQRYLTKNYTINSANTWEYKTITVDLSAGIASGGTWNTTNGTGLCLLFMLGAHADRTGNNGLNTWATGGSPAFALQTTGSVNLATIANSTFNITGVQLEKGSVATSFDYLPYTTELQLCQRYFQIVPFMGIAVNTGELGCLMPVKVQMRATASFNTALRNGTDYTGTLGMDNWGVAFTTVSGVSFGTVGQNGCLNFYATGSPALVAGRVYGGSTQASAEL